MRVLAVLLVCFTASPPQVYACEMGRIASDRVDGAGIMASESYGEENVQTSVAKSEYCFYIEQDDKCGQFWEYRAAQQGDLNSMVGVGLRLASSSDVSERNEGFEWLEKATVLGDAVAAAEWRKHVENGDIRITGSLIANVERMSKVGTARALEILSLVPIELLTRAGYDVPKAQQLAWLIESCRRSPLGSTWQTQNCTMLPALIASYSHNDQLEASRLAKELQPPSMNEIKLSP